MATTSPDPLGFDSYAQAIALRIDAALDTAHLSDDPLVAGIFGEWGSGKSHLLQFIFDVYRQTHRAAIAGTMGTADLGLPQDFALTLPVHFNPWKYEHEPHLLIPLVHHVRLAVESVQKDLASTASVEVLQALADAGTRFWRLARALASGVKFELNLGIAKATVDGGKAINAASAQTESPAADIPFESIYFQCHEYLADLVRPDNGPRLNFVVFIDDLDRCLPENAVQVLELIKTFLNLSAFAFVVALDDEIIERGVHHRYKEYRFHDREDQAPISGREYLEKIIHLPFRLPPLRAAQAEALIARRIDGMGADKDELQRAIFDPVEIPRNQRSETDLMAQDGGRSSKQAQLNISSSAHDEVASGRRIVDWILDSTPLVPRKLIRLLELFLFARQVLVGRGQQVRAGGIDPRLLLGICWVQLFAPELYRRIRQQRASFSLLAEWCKDKGELLSDGELDAILGIVPTPNVMNLPGASPEAEPTTYEYLHLKKPLAKFVKDFRKQRGGCESLLSLFRQLHPLLGNAFDSRILAPYLEWDVPPAAEFAAAEPGGRATGTASAAASPGRARRIADIQRTMDYLLSDSPATRQEVVALLDLNPGDTLELRDARALAERVALWLATVPTDIGPRRVIDGLYILAPYLEPYALREFYRETGLLGLTLRMPPERQPS